MTQGNVERIDYVSAGATRRVLPDLAQQQQMDMAQEIAKLRAENERLKVGATDRTYKVTEKGGLSVYGLGRFPVTLYKSQWRKLLTQAQAIEAFIVANESELTSKD